MLKRFILFALIVFAVQASTFSHADSLTETLDKACGKAVSALGCTDIATAYPEALGAVVVAVGAAHNQFSSAADCNAKLSVGSGILEKAKSIIDSIPGLPFDKLRQCSCNIVYSSQSCSGAVADFTNSVAQAINDFFSAIGLGSETQPPDDHAKRLADYYTQFYAPHLSELQHASDITAHDTMKVVSNQCFADWDQVPWVNDTKAEVCTPFWHQFFDQLDARQKLEKDAKQEALQKQLDALQKQQDAAIDNARKIAMSWAKIKMSIFGKQCADKTCVNDVGVLAFVYYGMIATGMQDVNASNTAVLVAANAKFDPLFKQKVMDSSKRQITGLALSLNFGKPIPVVLTPKAQKYTAAYEALLLKLTKLGVKDPEKTVVIGRRIYLTKLVSRGSIKQQ